MKNIIFILLITNSLGAIGQDLNVYQTVKYINEKLERNPRARGSSIEQHKISVSDDGYLIIYKQIYSNSFGSSSCLLEVSKFLIKNANVNYQSSALIYPQGTIGFTGMTSVKEGRGQCNSRNIPLTENYNFYSPFISFGNDEVIHEPLYNAFNHLFNLIKSDPASYGGSDPNDPFANKPAKSGNITTGSSSNVIKLEKDSGGVYSVNVVLNGVLRIKMIYDSGASDVVISPDVAMTLIRTGTLKESDYIGTQTYKFADGSTARSKRIIIRELQIGNQTIKNIEASISNSIEAPILLGQSALKRFGRIMIDNNTGTLYIRK